eukprot:Hpha_TRINITY_DN20637_c0_g1::TRINITY_DN20637_c0_g1_i1::g.148073::m.148073
MAVFSQAVPRVRLHGMWQTVPEYFGNASLQLDYDTASFWTSLASILTAPGSLAEVGSREYTPAEAWGRALETEPFRPHAFNSALASWPQDGTRVVAVFGRWFSAEDCTRRAYALECDPAAAASAEHATRRLGGCAADVDAWMALSRALLSLGVEGPVGGRWYST